MTKCRRPIHRSLLIGYIIFTLLLCLILSFEAYFLFSSALYDHYDEKLREVISHVEYVIDADDMRECMRTGVSSPKRDDLQQRLNHMVDDFELFYLYVVYPEGELMVNLCSATSEEERANGEVDLALFETSDAYTPDQLKPYFEAMETEGISYFEEISDWGSCYTACKPLVTSDGEVIGLICADLETGDLHHTVNTYVVSTILLTIATGAVFCLLLFFWLKNNITDPVLALEKSARRFMNDNLGRMDLELTPFKSPEIHTGNEVEALSETIKGMTAEMKNYLDNLRFANERAENAEVEKEGLTRIAMQDALTRLKSLAAYKIKEEELNADIHSEKAEFALVMIDLNGLKVINDRYGHENGDRFIIGTTDVISSVFKRSPLYRIGGDEFIAVLQGSDYMHRDELMENLRSRLKESSEDILREPWDRYSASVGIGVYMAGGEDTLEDVFRRADEAMYREKRDLKRSE